MNIPTKGKIFLIPSPLAEETNDLFVHHQLREIVRTTKFFLVEKARTARRFISSLKLGLDIEQLNFEVLDKDTPYESLSELCQPLYRGHDIGVLSEAGCPGVADPGQMVVDYAHRNKVEVIPLVGPSSILLALMSSGFNGQSFAFSGYLPIERKLRQKHILKLEKAAIEQNQTQIFMETPYRNEMLMKDLQSVCKSTTRLCIAKDITGEHQTIQTKSIADWKKSPLKIHKIPVIFVLGR